MARTPVPTTELVVNSNIADPAGTAVDPTNGHIISVAPLPAGAQLEELHIEINSTFAGAKTFTFKAGANPPALSAGQGDLVVSLNAVVGHVGPFSSSGSRRRTARSGSTSRRAPRARSRRSTSRGRPKAMSDQTVVRLRGEGGGEWE